MTLYIHPRLLRAVLGSMSTFIYGPAVPLILQRRITDFTGLLLRPPRGTTVSKTTVGGVPGEWLTPPGSGSGVILYFHGGGYVLGSPSSHRGLAARLAAFASSRALCIDYRRAPEHPYPAAEEDAFAAWQGLTRSGTAPGQIAVAGDSCGAALALTVALTAKEAGEPLPAVVGMICPWLDINAVPNPAAFRREPLLTPRMLARWASSYVPPDSTDASPDLLASDLDGLPPLIVHSAGDDPLSQDVERLDRRTSTTGTRLEHTHYDGLWHDFHALAPLLKPAEEALHSLGTKLGNHLAHP